MFRFLLSTALYISLLFPAYAHTVTILGNAQSSERVSSLVVTKGAPFKKTPLYKIQIKDIKVGELLLIHTDAQVTTPYTYNVMIVSDVVLISDNGNTIIELCEGQGQNFNKDEHHFNWTRVCTYENLIERTGVWWIYHRAWSASTAASSGHKLAVDQDAGRITAWRFTP